MLTLINNKMTFRTTLYYIGMILIICLLVGYTIFQARFIIIGPVIIMYNIPEVVQTQRLIILEGNAQNIIKITLNGRQIYTDKNGYFKEKLILENGYTISTLQVHDRFGRTSSYTHHFVYQPILME